MFAKQGKREEGFTALKPWPLFQKEEREEVVQKFRGRFHEIVLLNFPLFLYLYFLFQGKSVLL